MVVETKSTMKKILLLSSLVLAAVCTQTAFAQNPADEAHAPFRAEDLPASIAKGMTREGVSLLLGAPSETLGANVWVYWNFNAKGAAPASKHDTLVVVFSDYRVRNLRLCESKPVRELIAKQKAKAASKPTVAKK